MLLGSVCVLVRVAFFGIDSSCLLCACVLDAQDLELRERQRDRERDRGQTMRMRKILSVNVEQVEMTRRSG